MVRSKPSGVDVKIRIREAQNETAPTDPEHFQHVNKAPNAFRSAYGFDDVNSFLPQTLCPLVRHFFP
jgi:hypothetical protein